MGIQVKMCPVRVARRISGTGVSSVMGRNLGYCRLFVARLLLKTLSICAFEVIFLTPSLPAQQDGAASGAAPGWPMHNSQRAAQHLVGPCTTPRQIMRFPTR